MTYARRHPPDDGPMPPTLIHALGNRQGGRIRLRTATLEPYAYVSCEHPEELLDVIRLMLGPTHWFECDDGSIVQLRHVVKVEIA